MNSAAHSATLDALSDAGRNLHHEATMAASAIRAICLAIDKEGTNADVRGFAHALRFVAAGLDKAGNEFDEADVAAFNVAA